MPSIKVRDLFSAYLTANRVRSEIAPSADVQKGYGEALVATVTLLEILEGSEAMVEVTDARASSLIPFLTRQAATVPFIQEQPG